MLDRAVFSGCIHRLENQQQGVTIRSVKQTLQLGQFLDLLSQEPLVMGLRLIQGFDLGRPVVESQRPSRRDPKFRKIQFHTLEVSNYPGERNGTTLIRRAILDCTCAPSSAAERPKVRSNFVVGSIPPLAEALRKFATAGAPSPAREVRALPRDASTLRQSAANVRQLGGFIRWWSRVAVANFSPGRRSARPTKATCQTRALRRANSCSFGTINDDYGFVIEGCNTRLKTQPDNYPVV